MSYCTEKDFKVAPGVYTHDYTKEEVEAAQGCCQKFVCGIPCPSTFNTAGVALGFGVPVVFVSFSWVVMGFLIAMVYIKRRDYRGFFVCHRTLPLYIVTFALLGQGLDTSSSLGNAVNSYKASFWDGAVVPLGVALSLILNGLLLAAPLNRMGLLTLPDLFRRKYGLLMEVMVSFIEIASFTVLLAGNLVGISLVLQFCFGLPKGPGIAISGVVLALYTAGGGLYSVALTDIPQALGGLSGLFVTAVYVLATEKGGMVPPPSAGFVVDLGGNVTARTPGYSGSIACTDPVTGTRTCDNYAYPSGDKAVNLNGMTDVDAYAPQPNGIMYNWCSIFVLGFGNLCALDFQARCFAAKCPRTARNACFIAGSLLLTVSLPFGVLGGLARKYFGPDSPYALFEPDTCSEPLGRPSCAQWVPRENMAVFMLLWEKVPRALGAWTMIALVAASVSTADGAILATATVTAHNLWRKVPRIGSNEDNLLLMSRLFIVPMTLLACMTAMLAYRTSYLLVVAFDIVFAGVLVPLLAAVFAPNVSPNAGILSCLAGSLLRVTLEQVLPKDGTLVAPLGRYNLNYGRALPGLPSFMEVDPPELTKAAGVWSPAEDQCQQTPMADWTGLDSFLSPLFSLLVLVAVTLIERRWPGLDILWFVPKSWRQSSPLYASEDASSHGKKPPNNFDAPSQLSSRHIRRHATMPSVPEEEYDNLEDIEGAGYDTGLQKEMAGGSTYDRRCETGGLSSPALLGYGNCVPHGSDSSIDTLSLPRRGSSTNACGEAISGRGEVAVEMVDGTILRGTGKAGTTERESSAGGSHGLVPKPAPGPTVMAGASEPRLRAPEPAVTAAAAAAAAAAAVFTGSSAQPLQSANSAALVRRPTL